MDYVVQRLGGDGGLIQLCLVDATGLVLGQRSWIYFSPEAALETKVVTYANLTGAQGIFDVLAGSMADEGVNTAALMPGTFDKDVLTAILTSQILGAEHPD